MPAQSPPALPAEPDLTPLEKAVATQLGEARQHAAGILRDTAAGAAARSDALGELGQLYQVYGLEEAALACYGEAARLAPQDFRWPYLSACLAQSAGRLEPAERGYRRAIELRADWLPAFVHLGEVLLAGNRPEEGERALRQALALAPESAAAKAVLGQIALSRRDFRAAVDLLEAALAAAPEANRLHYPLGLAYRGLGEAEKARDHLARAGTVGVAPNDPLLASLEELRSGEGPHLRQGLLLLRNGRVAEAIAELRLALVANPKSVPGHVNLGAALLQSGDRTRARESLSQAVALAPENTSAHFNLGVLLAQEGEDEGALRELDAVVRLDPGDAAAWLERGRIHERRGAREEALADYGRAADLAPLDEAAQMADADLQVRLGRWGEARSRLERAHPDLPGSARITYALARLLAACPDPAQRDGQKALPLAEAAYAARPTPGALEIQAMALAELGRCPEAAQKQREAIDLARRGALDPALIATYEKDLERYAAGPPCRYGLPKP
jgi:tetratricopeptide (TPR) repeat protein